MCAWFGHGLAAVTIVLYSPDSKQDPSYLILTDNYLYSKDAHIRCQLQQWCDDLLHLQHLWATPLISSILYASHINAADTLANENPHHLMWLPIVSAPPTQDLTYISIFNDHKSDESNTEELEMMIDGMDGMGQVLLTEALAGAEEGDNDDTEVQLSALAAAVWQTLVSMCLATLSILCSSSYPAWTHL